MKLVRSLDEYIEPEELLLGTRDEVIYKNGETKIIQKNETFQYFSIKKTLDLTIVKSY